MSNTGFVFEKKCYLFTPNVGMRKQPTGCKTPARTFDGMLKLNRKRPNEPKTQKKKL